MRRSRRLRSLPGARAIRGRRRADHVAARPRPPAGRRRRSVAPDGGAVAGTRPASAPSMRTVATAWGLKPTAGGDAPQGARTFADHELNASTFAVRVVASTGASLALAWPAGLPLSAAPGMAGPRAASKRCSRRSSASAIRARRRRAARPWRAHAGVRSSALSRRRSARRRSSRAGLPKIAARPRAARALIAKHGAPATQLRSGAGVDRARSASSGRHRIGTLRHRPHDWLDRTCLGASV